MLRQWLQHLGIQSESKTNPNNLEIAQIGGTSFVEQAQIAVENLAKNTLRAIEKLRELVVSIELNPITEIWEKASEHLAFIIGFGFSKPNNCTISTNTT